MTAPTELDRWADQLRETRPELLGLEPRKRPARSRWDPVLQRVYGIRPWEIGRYSLREYDLLMDDLEKHGLGF